MTRPVYVAGHRGMVGSAILRQLEARGIETVTRGREDLDLRDQSAVASFFQDARPEAVAFAAARVGGIHANDTRPAEFIYEACTGQFIQFQGNDDCWIFVNDELVIDLGGMQAGQPQTIRLDRLDLTDGDLYSFKLFFANRQSNRSSFRLRTNVQLSQEGIIPTVSAQFD